MYAEQTRSSRREGELMKLSLTTESFAQAIQGGRMNLQKIIDFAGQNGFEGLEIVNRREVWRKDIGDDVKMNIARMREKKLRYFSYGVYEDMASPDPQIRWRAMNKVREAVLLACITNVHDLCVMGTGLTERNQDWDLVRRHLVLGLKDCLELAERKRITISLMNGGTLFNGSTRMLQVLQDVGSEYLKVTVDIAAFFAVDEEPADAVRTLLGDIRTVHLTDVKSADGYAANAITTASGKQLAPCVLGEGIVPQREVLYTLKQIGFDGYLCVLYQGEEEPAVGIDRSTAYLKSIFREVRSA